jgi:hypothetical protein
MQATQDVEAGKQHGMGIELDTREAACNRTAAKLRCHVKWITTALIAGLRIRWPPCHVRTSSFDRATFRRNVSMQWRFHGDMREKRAAVDERRWFRFHKVIHR